jgi:hypothetical protein
MIVSGYFYLLVCIMKKRQHKVLPTVPEKGRAKEQNTVLPTVPEKGRAKEKSEKGRAKENLHSLKTRPTISAFSNLKTRLKDLAAL